MSKARDLAKVGSNLPNGLTFRNRIINGAMVIDQRNAGASVTVNADAAFFAADRFQAAGQGSDGVYTIQQSSVAPAGFVNSIVATVTTADSSLSAFQQYNIQQHIEGYNVADLNWGTADAKSVTLSFWVRSSLTGTFSGALRNSAANRSYPFSYSISAANTWTQITVTVAGDTTGTWLTTNGTGINVIWTLGAGTSRLGSANSWQAANYQGVTGQTQWISTNGATFYITGVQLEAATTATAFEHRPFGQELALCQRYFYKNGLLVNIGLSSGMSTAGNRGMFNFEYKVTMRAAPTFGYGGSLTMTDNATYNSVVSSIDASFANAQSSRISLLGDNIMTTYRPATLACFGNDGFYTLTAEL